MYVCFQTNGGIEGTLTGEPGTVELLLGTLKEAGYLKAINRNQGRGWEENPIVNAPLTNAGAGHQPPLVAPSWFDGSHGAKPTANAGQGQQRPHKGSQQPLVAPTMRF